MMISTIDFAARKRAFHVALEQRGEGFLVLPFRMLGCERLDTVEREEDLEIHRLFGPQGAVVVEHGDAFSGWHEVGGACLRYLLPRRR